jgi:hypothetical protein
MNVLASHSRFQAVAARISSSSARLHKSGEEDTGGAQVSPFALHSCEPGIRIGALILTAATPPFASVNKNTLFDGELASEPLTAMSMKLCQTSSAPLRIRPPHPVRAQSSSNGVQTIQGLLSFHHLLPKILWWFVVSCFPFERNVDDEVFIGKRDLMMLRIF